MSRDSEIDNLKRELAEAKRAFERAASLTERVVAERDREREAAGEYIAKLHEGIAALREERDAALEVLNMVGERTENVK